MSALTPPLGRPLLDPAEHFPALAALRSAVLRKDASAVAAAFAALPDEDDRVLACWTVVETPDAETFLREAASDRPDDPLPRTLLAHALIRRGWEIRGETRAEHVTQERFDRFHSHLRRAEILLIDLCAEDPRNALAWYLRLIGARGLELGQSEARRRHDRLAEHHPHHFGAQSQLLQQLCPKWGGTWEEAHGYARDRAAAAPEGAPNGALLAVVQLERYLDIARDRTKQAAEAYLREADSRAELLAASARSVLHPAARPDAYQHVAAHNAFAAAHSLAGRPADAAPHFRALGDRATEFPWGYVGADHAGAFARHRKTALAQG
ncbi:hypothetical protein [Streptomyces sp. NPDC048606]|uniref:hypothetical protein n=1 Tax=Streptomyces sp. NPDC048606 TaxID=3154726 RepID=UPI003446EAFA